MDFEIELLNEHSKPKAEEIANFIIQNPNYFQKLFELLYHEDIRVVQRASWPLSILCKKNATLFLPYFSQMLESLENKEKQTLKRNIYRLLQDLNIPEDYCGLLFQYTLRDLCHPKTPVGIKAFCMTVAFNISKTYPELQRELKICIEENSKNQSPGYYARSKKILAALN